MLNDKQRQKLIKAQKRAESKGNFNSAAHKILAQNPVEGVTPQKRKVAYKEKLDGE